MIARERSVTVVLGHRASEVPAEASAAQLTATVAAVLSTYRKDNTDMVLDHELWLACMEAVGAATAATGSDVFAYPDSRFLNRLLRRRHGRSIGSLGDYAARIRGDQDAEEWHTILWRNGAGLVGAATCERWYLCGGPPPYHDSYTTSLFLHPSAAERLVDELQRAVSQAGGWVDAVLDAPGTT